MKIFNTNELTTTLVIVNGLVNGDTYNVCIYAYNKIDTNYNMYLIDVINIPKPIEVNDLIQNLNDDEQISLK